MRTRPEKHLSDQYPSPPSALENLSYQPPLLEGRNDEEHSSSIARFQSKKCGTGLSISFFEGIGWSLETHIEQGTDEAKRVQPISELTGAQRNLGKGNLTFKDDGALFELCTEEQTLRIRSDDAALELFSGGGLVFRSGEAPFARWSEPRRVWEGLMSRKVTDLSWRSPLGIVGAQFESPQFDSHMVRFSYDRPTGPVLGLAGQSGELNRNGYRFELYNTDEFVHTPARKPLYQSWPIVFHQALDGQQWIAVFFDNPSRMFVDIGDFSPERLSFEAVEGAHRVYICVGSSLSEVSSKISRLLGGHSLPPAWALGYQQSRWSYMSTAEIREVAARLRAEGYPCDAIHFDIDYMEGYRVFTHNQEHFRDLKDCLADLHRTGFKAVCIVDPGVKVEEGSDLSSALYRELLADGKVLRSTEGEPLTARVWPGDVVLPDFGDAQTRTLWARAQQQWLNDFPFDGIWNDMNEPSNFNGQNSTTSKAHTARGAFRSESNLYGYYMAQASREGWERAAPGVRPLIISRSGYPGVQQSAVNWQGDNQAWWEHLRLAIDMSIQFSLSGAFYTGADVPGFTGNPPDDLAVRFFQLGAWLPFFRGHSIFFAKDKEPFAFGGAAQEAIRQALLQRYSLAREWYSGFESACRNFSAVTSPVLTEAGSLARDQFLCFDKFLVAPVVDRDPEVRTFFLPEGLWYRLGAPHDDPVRGPRWQTIPVEIGDTPVFVRGGSVVVRNIPGTHMSASLSSPERFEVYRDEKGEAQGYWYDDDLISVDPKQVTRRRLCVEAGDATLRVMNMDD